MKPPTNPVRFIAIGGAIREDFSRSLHVMKLYSDDMVSEDLVSFVTERPGTNFMVRRGYVWYAPSYELTLSRGFHQLSGSRCIFWVAPSDLPTSPEDRRALYSQIMQSPHEETFLSLGRTVDRVHWPAVMYRRGNAEAISNDYATGSYKRLKNYQRPTTQRILRKASQLIWKSYVAATRHHMRQASRTEPVFRRFGIINPGCETCELGR